jgi:hypothetical protein
VIAEVAAAVTVALPVEARWGFILSGLLLMAFTGAIVRAIRRGAAVPCRCFGPSTRPPDRWHVVRNAALLAVCGVGAVAGSLDPSSRPETSVVSIAGGVAVALLLINLDSIAALFKPFTFQEGNR